MTLTHLNAFWKTCICPLPCCSLRLCCLLSARVSVCVQIPSSSIMSGLFLHSLQACMQYPVIIVGLESFVWFWVFVSKWIAAISGVHLNSWEQPEDHCELSAGTWVVEPGVCGMLFCVCHPASKSSVMIKRESMQAGSRKTIELFEGESYFLEQFQWISKVQITSPRTNLVANQSS